jgi:hypothetical protein
MTLTKTLWIGAALLLLASAAWVLGRYGKTLAGAIDRRRYPDIPRAASPLGGALDADIRRRKIEAFNWESRRVSELVGEAAQQGHEVGELRDRLEHAARLAEAGRFGDASMLLNIVEVRLPRKSESVVPAAEDEPAPSERKVRRKARRSRGGP